jgi:hypothetical protein
MPAHASMSTFSPHVNVAPLRTRMLHDVFPQIVSQPIDQPTRSWSIISFLNVERATLCAAFDVEPTHTSTSTHRFRFNNKESSIARVMRTQSSHAIKTRN